MTLVMWTLVIAVLTAVACALCGTLLVVKREAFVSEALSHAVLPGILVAYLIFRDRGSPMLILSASLAGLLMVLCVRLMSKTNLVYDDAALGIVFAALFSVGVILANQNLSGVHFHEHHGQPVGQQICCCGRSDHQGNHQNRARCFESRNRRR